MEIGKIYNFNNKEYVKGFTWCSKIPEIIELNIHTVNGSRSLWLFKCPETNKLHEINCYDLTGQLTLDGRKIVNKYKIVNNDPFLILCRAIVDVCYSCKKCPNPHPIGFNLVFDQKNNIWIDETSYSDHIKNDVKNVSAHRMLVCLVCNYSSQLVAETVMRLGSKGHDGVRRMLANIAKGYVNIENEYREIVKEMLEKRSDGTIKIDRSGRASLSSYYQRNQNLRQSLWNKYFEKSKLLDQFIIKEEEKSNKKNCSIYNEVVELKEKVNKLEKIVNELRQVAQVNFSSKHV